jgi:hypothetical protein
MKNSFHLSCHLICHGFNLRKNNYLTGELNSFLRAIGCYKYFTIGQNTGPVAKSNRASFFKPRQTLTLVWAVSVKQQVDKRQKRQNIIPWQISA